MKKIYITLYCFWSILLLNAQNPGDLFESFGTSGITTFDYLGLDQTAWDIAIQENDKIIVAGDCDGDILVMRYLSNGTLDASFGESGKRLIDLGGAEQATCVDIDSNGDIMIGGLLGWEDCFVLRLLPDGSLDDAFGNDGVLEIYGNISAVDDIKILEDHKFIIGGWEFKDDLVVGALMKLTPVGEIYENFGENGHVFLDYTEENISVSFEQIEILENKNILAAGRSTSSDEQVLIASFYEDGSLNESFGYQGVRFLGAPDEDNYFGAMVIDEAGRIVLCNDFATASERIDRDLMFNRLLPNGNIDYSFNDGELILDLGNTASEYISSMMLESDGKYIAAGGANNDLLLLRISKDGTIDDSFGSDGFVQTDVYGGFDVFFTLGMQSDMNIVAAGKAFFAAESDYDVTLAKYYSGLFAGENEIGPTATEMDIYPNPASDLFEINLQKDYTGKAYLSIVNTTGKRLYSQHAEVNRGIIQVMNLNLEEGIYYVQLKVDDELFTNKLFIKTK